MENKPVIHKALRLFFWTLGIFLTILIIPAIVFELNKEKIKTQLVTALNQHLQGELAVTSVQFSLLHNFPDVSLRMNGVEIFENGTPARLPDEPPFCKIDKFYVGLDIFSLIRGDINVAELSAEGGGIDIIVRPDSSVNIFNVLLPDQDSPSPGAADGQKAAVLRINKVVLKDIRLTYHNHLSGYHVDLQITEFENRLTLSEQRLDLQLNPQIEILKVERGKYRFLENTRLEMSVSMEMDLDSLNGHIGKGLVRIEGAQLHFSGDFDFRDAYFLDLHIASALNDPSLLLLIFNEEIVARNLENMQQGRIYFDGRITGDLGSGAPYAEFRFGVSRLNLKVPGSRREIKNFGFEGYFTTGEKSDLSDGVLSLTGISADGPAGHSQGAVQIRNFDRPVIDADLDLMIDLAAIDRALKFVRIPVYSGILKVRGGIRMNFDKNLQNLRSREGNLEVDLKDCSFLIEKTGRICETLSGKFTMQDNRIAIQDLQISAPGNRFTVNGTITNLLNHLSGIDSEVTAVLKLEADSLDFNTFLTSNEVGQWVLDEYCRKAAVDVEFHSESSRLRQASALPPGTLTFHTVRMDLKNVADVHIREGLAVIGPDVLDLRNIRAEINDNHVFFSGAIQNYPDLFANEYQDSCRISLELNSGQLRLKDFFTYKDMNYLPEYWAESGYRDFNLSAAMILPANTDSLTPPPYAFRLQVQNLSGINTRTGTRIRDLSLAAAQAGNDLNLRNINGRIGQTRIVRSDLDLADLFAGQTDMRIRLDLNCNQLDVGEWLGMAFEADSTEYAETEVISDAGEQLSRIEIPVLDISANIGRISYLANYMQNFRASVRTKKKNIVHLDHSDGTWWIPEIDLNARIDSDTFKTDYFEVPQAHERIVTSGGVIEIYPSHTRLSGAGGDGKLSIDLAQKQHRYHLSYSFRNYKIEKLLARLGQEEHMSGVIDLSLDLKMDGAELKGLDGDISLSGKDLIVYNIDIDELLERFQRTQSFNLIDVGAFLLAGPAGALVTKTSDYVILLNIDPAKQTRINNFISSWELEAGRLKARDVALTTAKSRIALQGGVDFNRNEFVDFTVAVVDKKGCPLISQMITGSIFAPQLQKISAVSTILAPVTNVLKQIAGAGCQPFYTGSVPHPD